jgi:hypothetical protein
MEGHTRIGQDFVFNKQVHEYAGELHGDSQHMVLVLCMLMHKVFSHDNRLVHHMLPHHCYFSELNFVVTVHNNDEQYMRSKRERSRERDTQI